MYAMIEKKAYETMKSVGMDVKGARAELKSLCDTNLNAIRELRSTVNSLAGKPQEDKQDKGKQTTVAVEEQMKAIADAAKNVAEMQGRMVVVEGHIESHEQRLTDQGAQIYDISAKVRPPAPPEISDQDTGRPASLSKRRAGSGAYRAGQGIEWHPRRHPGEHVRCLVAAHRTSSLPAAPHLGSISSHRICSAGLAGKRSVAAAGED